MPYRRDPPGSIPVRSEDGELVAPIRTEYTRFGWVEVPERPWDEVVPGLFQGGAQRGIEARDGFHVVVTLAEESALVHPAPEAALTVDWFIPDERAPDPRRLDEVAATIRAHHDDGRRVLVRCAAGLNRSGLLVGAVLIDRGAPAAEAIARIRAARGPYALCNPDFVRALHERGR
jgi:protein-tyrosine phosphatase